MPNKYFRSARTMNYQKDPVMIAGSFSVGGGAIVAGSIHGDGFTVAYTALGRYTVTLRDRFRHYLTHGACLGLTTPLVDNVVRTRVPVGGAAAANTIEVDISTTLGAGAAADPANVLDRVSFWCLMSNSYQDT